MENQKVVTEAASEKDINSYFYPPWDLEKEGNGTWDEPEKFLSLIAFERPSRDSINLSR